MSAGGKRWSATAATLAATAWVGACGNGPDIAVQGDPVAGKRIVEEIAEPGCGRCHTLAAAGFEGEAAPNLDQLRPGYQRVLDALRTGPGAMPAFDEQLDEKQLHDVAAYVSDAAAR